ncbi:hypothetical protein BJY01DRAFT_120197 [Aspergillus pseudoustus]|uniref:F-box domain-containing protein n=1 Tax=Aspergillus pseudoustus TaxID=1810923 RepID=A0ABR4KFU7_9EURO
MPLHALPTEILCVILRFVGSQELRKHNARCLLVCKWWHAIAEPILYEDLGVSANQLLRLPRSAQGKLARHGSRLRVYASRAKDWPSSLVEDNDNLNDRLDMLLSQGACLKSFSLRTDLHFDSSLPLAPSQHYLYNWTPAPLLNSLRASQIQDLEIDTYGSDFKHGVHICPDIARIIPSLRSLRLRMRRICPKVLRLKHQERGLPVRIRSIIVNISLLEPGTLSSGSSRHCERFKSTLELFEQMVDASTATATHIPSLTKARVLWHAFHSNDTLVHDCITGRSEILRPGDDSNWEDEGRPDPEEEENSNLEIASAGSNGGGGSGSG